MMNSESWLYGGQSTLTLSPSVESLDTSPSLVAIRKTAEGYVFAVARRIGTADDAFDWLRLTIRPASESDWAATSEQLAGSCQFKQHPSDTDSEWHILFELTQQPSVSDNSWSFVGPSELKRVVSRTDSDRVALQHHKLRRITYPEFDRQAKKMGLDVFLGP